MSRLALTPWDIVRVLLPDAGGFVDANPAVGAPDPLVKFIDQNGAEKVPKYLKNTISQKSTLKELLPSLFTGGMRRLMQTAHLNGEGYISNFGYDQFGYGWSDTYGIFISAPIDGFCQRWVIRICNAGIFRIPITFKHPLPANWLSLEVAARALSPVDASKEYGKYWIAGKPKFDEAVSIGFAPSMYSGHSGFYGACGWAFSSNGHHAVNTAWKIDPADGSGIRKLASLWQVTITEDAGVPVTATCSKTEEDYLMNTRRDDAAATENNAILQVATATPGVCQTFTCWPGFSGVPAGTTSTAAPIFTYYDADDALQVVRYNYAASASNETISSGTSDLSMYSAPAEVHGNIPGGLGTAYGANRVNIPGAWSTAARGYVATPLFSSAAISGGSQGYSAGRTDGSYVLDGPSGYIQNENWSISYAAYNVTWIDEHGDPHTLTRRIDEPDRANWRRRAQAQGWTKHTTNSNETQNNYDCLILHGYDRTSYVHFRYEGNAKRNKVRTRIGAPVARSSSPIPELSQDAGATWNSLSIGSLGYSAYEGESVGVVWHEHDGSIYSDSSGDIAPQGGFTGNGLGPGSAETYYDPDEFNDLVQMFLVIGSQSFELEGDQFLTDGNMVTDIYLDGATFNYTACGSIFQPTRNAYDTYLNATSVATGFGYPACANRLHAFLGYF